MRGSTKLGIAGGAVVLVVLVATVAVVLVVRHQRADGSPSAVAAAWMRAGLDGDDDRVRQLECRGAGQQGFDALRLAAPTTKVSAGVAHGDGPDQWTVPLTIGGTTTTTVEVVRQHGRYEVCPQ